MMNLGTGSRVDTGGFQWVESRVDTGGINFENPGLTPAGLILKFDKVPGLTPAGFNLKFDKVPGLIPAGLKVTIKQ